MYARGLTIKWVKWGWVQICSGAAEVGVFLLPSRTGSDWFHFLLYRNVEFRINRGRLKFKVYCKDCGTEIKVNTQHFQEKLSGDSFCIKCGPNNPGKMDKMSNLNGAPFDSLVAILRPGTKSNTY